MLCAEKVGIRRQYNTFDRQQSKPAQIRQTTGSQNSVIVILFDSGSHLFPFAADLLMAAQSNS